MNDVAIAVGVVVLATLAFGVLFVLPGLALAERIVPPGAIVGQVLVAHAIAMLLVTGWGALLLAQGTFSGALVAAGPLVWAAVSIPALWRLTGAVRRSGRVRDAALFGAFLVVLVLPLAWSVTQPGYPPADTLQWYYAGLGRQLSGASGVPLSVAEFGEAIRWLPDYIVFDIASEGYRAVVAAPDPMVALAAWRVPVALLGLLATCWVLRLWMSRVVAVVGLAGVASTVFFLAKFDAYKPEALGIVLGLIALGSAVRGIRARRRSWILTAAAVLGADLAVHAIAATVCGLLVLAAAGIAWLAGRDRARVLGWGVQAAVLGLAVSMAIGYGLQGRAIVAGEALNPALVEGADPTWTYFLRSTGDFTEPEPAPPARPLAGGVGSPWPGFRLTSAFGWWLIAVGGIGAFLLAAFGGRRGREAVATIVMAGVLLGAGIGFFALAFETYVPRWTGLVRFGQYVPLLAATGVAIGLEGYRLAWRRLTGLRLAWAVPLAAVLGAAWLLPLAYDRYAGDPRIAPAGHEALTTLASLGGPADAVLSNALTTGTLEAFSGLEAPLEGRQPLIEDPALLATANERLLAAHRFFVDPADRAILDELGTRWLVALDDPATLGATATLGGSPAALRGVEGLREAWSGDGVAIFEVTDLQTTPVVDDLRPSAIAEAVAVAAAALAAVVLVIGGLALVGRRLALVGRRLALGPRSVPPDA
jgi:hypothetical protein